ncbi:MAG TPA: hypothetical protein VK699_12050 [Terriglobales bacterium]|jgi:hypothetical protein|nr:hypothetical protein [Terriglobales bacterium]
MHRLLAITVLAAAAVLPPHLGAQRGGGMRFGGGGTHFGGSGFRGSAGPRGVAGPNFRTFPGSRGSFGHFGGGGFNRGFAFTGVGFGHNPHFRLFAGSCFGCRGRFGRGGFFYPYIYPGYYSSYGYYSPYYDQPFYDQSSYPAYQSSPTVVVQAAPPADYGQNQQLVGEVEGLRQEVQQLRQEQNSRQQPRPSGTQSSASVQVSATVLVFRDGHRSEVHNYAIAGTTLWILNERQAKKVLISELDVPATQAANAERGVEFALPQ